MKKKRLTALLLAVLMLASLLAGCKKSDTDDGTGDNTSGTNGTNATEIVDDRPEYIWHATFTNIESTLDWVRDSTQCGDKFYLIGSYVSGHETGTDPDTLESWDYDTYDDGIFVMNTDGTDLHLLEGFSSTDEASDDGYGGSSIHNIAASPTGELWLLKYTYHQNFDLPEDFDESTMSVWDYYISSDETYSVHKLDADGNEIFSVDARSLVDDTSGLYDNYFYVNSMKVDKSGNVYLFLDYSCLILDENGNKITEINADMDNNIYFYSPINLGDAGFGVSVYDNDEGKQVILPIDLETKSLGDPINLPYDAYSLYPGTGDYDFYYLSSYSLMGYKSDTGESEELFNFVNLDVDSSNLNLFAPLEDGTFIGISTTYNYNYLTETSESTMELFKIELVPSSTVPLKTTLTLACMYLNYNVRRQILSFNKSSDEYHIDVTDYSQYNTEDDYSAGQTKLITEVLSGKMPDLICTDSMPISRFAAKGLLEDLWSYIDNDTELGGRSGVVEPFFNALSEDGKLYQISSGFSVRTVAGPTMLVGDRMSWTIDDLLDALSQMPEGADVFSPYYTKANALQDVCYMMMDDFIDWETGECSFDSEDFIGILNFTNLFPDSFDWDNYDWELDYMSDDQRFREGKQMLSQLYLYTFTDWQYTEATMGTEISFIGYPVATGIGSAFYPESGIAMSSTCKDKDGAWAFISSFLSKDYQEQYVYYLPTNKEVFDEKLEKAMTPTYSTDPETGEQVEQPKDSYWFSEDNIYYIYALTQEEADKVLDLIDSTERIYTYNETIYSVISDECTAFFAGQKTAEETAKLVQSRLNIYVNEQR